MKMTMFLIIVINGKKIRIICTRTPTHKINSSKMLKFKEEVGNRLVVTENRYEEIL